MKVTIGKDAICGKVFIPAAEYMVSLSSESSEIVLTGAGKQYKVPAIKRRQQARTKVTSVSFYSGGGPIWSLVLSTPKFGEWVAMLEYGATKEDKK